MNKEQLNKLKEFEEQLQMVMMKTDAKAEELLNAKEFKRYYLCDFSETMWFMIKDFSEFRRDIEKQ